MVLSGGFHFLFPPTMRRFALAVAAAALAYLYCRSREQAMPSVDRPTSERRAFWLFGTPISEQFDPAGPLSTDIGSNRALSLSGHSLSPLAHNTVFEALDLPNHRFELHETASFHDASILERIRSPTFGGGAVTMPHKVEALQYMDSLGDEVNEIGSMNTIVVTGHVEENGARRPKLEGRNTDTEGIRRALLATLAEGMRSRPRPFGEGKSAFIGAALSSFRVSGQTHMHGTLTFDYWRAVGGGGTTRAAIHALSNMGLSPIWLVNRDPTETASIIASPPFAKYDLRPLERIEQWTEEEAERVTCGVGAIPSIAPQSEGEKLVYALAERIFSSTKSHAGGPRPFMEMAYKPHATLMYNIAQKHGWRPIGGEFWPVPLHSLGLSS